MSSTSTRAFYGMSVQSPDAMGGTTTPMVDGIMSGAGAFVSVLSDAKAKNARVLLKFVGHPSFYQNTDSSFSLKMWKDMMDIAAA
jgi:hypothetical protein